jgi:hypothetical protein
VPAASTVAPSRAVGIQRKEHRLLQLVEAGAQMHAAALEQPGGEAEPDGGVVVAAGQDDLGAGPGEADQGIVQEADDVDAGQSALIVDVPGDEHDVDGVFPDPGTTSWST